MILKPATESTDIRSAGAQIGLGARAAYRAAERGDIPAVKIGGRWVVPLKAWEKFLTGDWTPKHTTPPPQAPPAARLTA